jgi:hypothetical protein
MTSAKPSSEFVAAKTEELARTETELLEMFRKSNQEWSERLQAEMKLLSELGAKLNTARSIPEAAAAYQSYASQRIAMVSEDARHLFEDYQTLARTGARLWTTNWPIPPRAST